MRTPESKLAQKTNEIVHLKTTHDNAKETVTTEVQTGSAWNAYDSINQRCKAAEAEVDNKELELQKLRAEKEKLRSENLKLKQAVSTLGEHQEILQNQLTAKEEELLLAKNKNDVEETVAEHTHSSTKIEELLNSKLDQAVQNLKECL